MFDIGFSEIFLIAVVALLVLGPERLPKAARFAGLWVRRARAQWYSVKSELETELADDELKRSLQRTQEDLREARESLMKSGAALQEDLRRTERELQGALKEQEAGAAEEGASATGESSGETATADTGRPAEEEGERALGSAMEEFEPTPIEEDEDAIAARAPRPTEPSSATAVNGPKGQEHDTDARR